MSKSSERILLVDDDEGFRYAATKAFEGAGFAVSSAPDYRQALAVLEDDCPVDLLLTDIYMPERIHGFALVPMARMRRVGIKVLYVTAFDVPTVEDAGKVLRKPISNDELVDQVRLALAG